MIQLTKKIAKQIINHAQRELPLEACGYLAAQNSIINNAYEMMNIDKSPIHFSFDSQEQFEVFKKIKDADLNMVGNYHSHPTITANPSAEDIRLAHDPSIYYFIVSLASKTPVLKAFRIINQQVNEVEIILID